MKARLAKTIELGCAMAEIDLRYTADGELVLVHDATVDRTTDGTGRVAEKTLSELRGLDAGALSSDWGNWTQGVVADARRHRMATFVNVLGPSDTPENLRKAVALGFDYIQTDHPRQLLEILRERGARAGPSHSSMHRSGDRGGDQPRRPSR